MKNWSWLVVLVCTSVEAGTLVLHNGGTNTVTGDLLDEVDELWITTNTIEIPELTMSARAGNAGKKIKCHDQQPRRNRTWDRGDTTDRFDYGETMIISFDKTVEITEIDMVGFASNSTFVVDIGDLGPFTITYDDLASKSAQHFPTSIVVEADTDISLYAGNTNSVIGLQFIDLNVLESAGALYLSFQTSNDWITVEADFDGTAVTNYVLQSSTNLTSNVWNSVTGGIQY